jgi:uncharacterized membrane protein (UPF0182 family)
MQLIPVDTSLLYIRPVYVQGASGSQLPAFHYVVVWYNNQTVIDTTLQGALQQLFGGKPSPPATGQTGTTTPTAPGGGGATTPNSTVANLLAQATKAYNDAQTALGNKDLARYQQLINQVGQLLAQAQRAAAAPTPTTGAPPTTTTTRPGTPTSTSTPAPSA